MASLMALLLSLLLITLCTVQAFGDYHPVLIDRQTRDAPFNDILNDLKGQTLGGRMRFGKRSGEGASHPSLNQWRSQLLYRPY